MLVSSNFENTYIAAEELINKKLIGEGKFSEVYEAHWKTRVVAVKKLQIQSAMNYCISDFEGCFKIRHPNIVQNYGVCIGLGNIEFVMEKMDSSLESELDGRHGKTGFTLDEIADVITQVVCALAFLHKNEIIYGCLSPSKILKTGRNTIKLNDFGMLEIKKSGNYVENKIPNKSLRYRPSERFKRYAKMSKQADVFSLGMIIWEMFANKKPFADLTDEQELISFISKGNLEVIPSNCPERWANLIKKCWNPNPEQRPTMQQIEEELKLINADPAPDEATSQKPAEELTEEAGQYNSWLMLPESEQTAGEPKGEGAPLQSVPDNDYKKCIIS